MQKRLFLLLSIVLFNLLQGFVAVGCKDECIITASLPTPQANAFRECIEDVSQEQAASTLANTGQNALLEQNEQLSFAEKSIERLRIFTPIAKNFNDGLSFCHTINIRNTLLLLFSISNNDIFLITGNLRI